MSAAALGIILTALPEVLETAPKIGKGIYELLHANRAELPEETRARLDDVKLRQAAEDAEWEADLVGGDRDAGDAEADALVARLRDENQRLANENARLQAGPDDADPAPAPEA